MDDDVVRNKRATMDAATQSCLLVNHPRFGRSALDVLADLRAFAATITDAAFDENQEDATLQQAGFTQTMAKEDA